MRISEQLFPRPVVLITTVSVDGKPNVMTAIFVMPVSFEPKYVAFSISPKRHTFKNLEKTREFGLNVCSEEMKRIAGICGRYSGRDVNKFELAGIEVEDSRKIKPPLVKNSPVSFECEVVDMKEFGDHFLVVGKVVEEHLREKEFKPLLHKTLNVYPRIE